MTLGYLWREWKRHPMGTRKWLKSWAKRVYNLPALLRLEWRRQRLVSRGASIGPFSIVGNNAELNGPASRLRVGEWSAIGRAHIALHAEVEIGDCVTVSDDVTLLTGTHDISHRGLPLVARKIVIGDYAWVAQGAMVLPGVTIGRGAVVGAGAVVAKSVPDFSVAVGNPAVILLKRRPDDFDYSPVRFFAEFEAWLN
jgi:acetyltransferase-like isoleucine patch superfamily enzyme